MPEIEDYVREQIASFLPEAIKKALKSYREFSNMPATEDPGVFKSRNDASKVSIAHIQLLMKLATLVDLPEDTDEASGNDKHEQLRAMLETATSEVKDYIGRDHE